MATRTDAPQYTLTKAGLIAALPRGACGHIVCLPHTPICVLALPQPKAGS